MNQKLLNLVESIANAPKHAGLECDGLCHLLHYRLTEEGFDAHHLRGTVTFKDKMVAHDFLYHKAMVIDYRLKMWFGENSDVPHGIFLPIEWASVLKYEVTEQMPVMSAVDYFTLVSVRKPRLLRGVPGIVPPENLVQGRYDYIRQGMELAVAKGPRAVQKWLEFVNQDISFGVSPN